jgi:NAD(P)-dependent dehydrogenase (short-subunit alcohol dehydrogenase family)
MARTVLVTGCSSGIGRATAEAFRADGWTVYATARDRSDVADLAERGCRTATLDVTDGATVDAVVDRVLRETDGIDCVVNNAGVVDIASVEETSPEGFRDLFDVNLFGPHRVIHAVVPHMRERRRGRIVNVGSVAGRFPVPLEGAYCASKFGLRALSAVLRDELRPYDVSVVLVEPPYVRTRQAERETRASEGRGDSPYASLYDRFERAARKEYAAAPGPGTVAGTVLSAATADDPRPRYPVGTKARIQGMLGGLPPGLRYRLWAWSADR